MSESASNDNNQPRLRVLEDIARRFEQSVKVQHALFQIATLANTDGDLYSFYEQVHAVVKGLTSAEHLIIALIDEENGQVEFPYYVDAGLTSAPDKYADLDFVKRSAVTSLVFKSRKMVHVDKSTLLKLRSCHGIDVEIDEMPEDWLGIPLLQGDQVLGALVVQSYKSDFRYTTEDESIMEQIGQHVANALQRKVFNESLQEAKNALEENNERLTRSLSEKKEIHKRLKHNANHDSLTGLPNRAMFLRHLKQVIEQSHNDPEQKYAVLFMDLDRFKVVNDSLGHLVGDALLVEVGLRLRNCVRPTDLVARLGGDEFCVLLKQDATSTVVDLVAQRILTNLHLPMHLNGQRVVTGTSIGIAFGNVRYKTAETALRDADTALYHAKENGKSTYKVFDQSMREQAITRLQLEQALRLAVEESEITVHYQPIVEIRTGKVVSFEALARWIHPSMGNIPADKFIAIAEEIHLIPQLTLSVLRQATSQICQWRSEIAGLNELSLNVNISSSQIEEADFVQSIESAIKRVNLPTRNLKLEVTESMLLNNMEKASEILNELNDKGYGLALDDFGTGYSSLSCLNSLPLHELKVDLSFVRNIVEDSRSHAIVQMIVALANVMNLSVVAEGVETVAQLEILKDLGIKFAQGYLFGEPASATAITRQLCNSPNSGIVLPIGDITTSVNQPTQS